jgi:serine/threonine-protein kinase HipA
MHKLVVFLYEERVGELAQDDSGLLSFTYASEWLVKESAVPISRMLPLTAEPYDTRKARPFFAGILPEEGPRARIAEILGISERNDFAMLERIGGECAGAISLLPEGVPPLPLEHRRRTLAQKELEAIVTELPRRPLLAGEDGVRLSLAGAQDKLPVVVDGDSISLPLGNTPSTHIIKPEPAHFPGLVANEVFCMGLARTLGLSVPEVTYRMLGGKPCIIVARYDRVRRTTGGMTVRLHQEDFCQALGRPPEHKYQQEGGPMVRECVALLREWSTTPVLDIRAFVDGLILNMLIGNADAHGKNYSMLYRGGERRLAPLYDLVATIAWPELSARLAMSIGNGKNVNDVNPAHFKGMAEEASLGWPMVRERVDALADQVIMALEEGSLVRHSSDPAIAARLCELITGRCQRMR